MMDSKVHGGPGGSPDPTEPWDPHAPDDAWVDGVEDGPVPEDVWAEFSTRLDTEGLVDPGTWSETEWALAALDNIAHGQRFIGCHELMAVAQWADLHPGEAVIDSPVPGTETARQFGGDGTPLVAEFAIAEMAGGCQMVCVRGSVLRKDCDDDQDVGCDR